MILYLFPVYYPPPPHPLCTAEQRPHLPCSSVSFFSAWRIVDAQYLLLSELHLGLLPTHPLPCFSPAFSVYLPALSDLCPVVNALSQVSACTPTPLDSHPSSPALLLLLTWHARLPEGNLLFWSASAGTALLLICPRQPFILRSEVSEWALLLVSPCGQEKWSTFYVNTVMWGWVCDPCCVLGPGEPQLHPENMLWEASLYDECGSNLSSEYSLSV